VACYERMAQDERKGPDFYKGMVQCYLGLDQPITALRIAQGIVSERYERGFSVSFNKTNEVH